MKGFIRVAERRWDLRLENGITIKLPEDGIDGAIAEVLRMDRENGILQLYGLTSRVDIDFSRKTQRLLLERQPL